MIPKSLAGIRFQYLFSAFELLIINDEFKKKRNMKKINLLLLMLFSFTILWGQKPTTECVAFRDGFDKFPFPGKGTITLVSGQKIKGEFKEGLLIKMFKWQWYDTKGQLHEIKPDDVARVELLPDTKFLDKEIELNVNISIGGKSTSKVQQKNLPFNIDQFATFDRDKYYKPVVAERVVTKIGKDGKEKSKLMLLVNNGFDSKYKVYVNFGAKPISFGRGINLYSLLFGGGEMGDYYKSYRVVRVGEKKSMVLKKPALIPFLIGAFRNKEFVDLFGDSSDFMACYPKSFKRKFKYVPEFFWVYNQK